MMLSALFEQALNQAMANKPQLQQLEQKTIAITLTGALIMPRDFVVYFQNQYGHLMASDVATDAKIDVTITNPISGGNIMSARYMRGDEQIGKQAITLLESLDWQNLCDLSTGKQYVSDKAKTLFNLLEQRFF